MPHYIFKLFTTVAALSATVNLLGIDPLSISLASAVGISIGYLVCGGIWSAAKWNILVRNRKKMYNKIKEEWLRKRGVEGTTVIPEELKEFWGWYRKSDLKLSSINDLIPSAKEYRRDIASWIIIWPGSILDILAHISYKSGIGKVYGRHIELLQRDGNKVFADAKDDF